MINNKLNETFDINTQYKMLQLSEYIERELNIAQTQLSLLIDKYGEKDDSGNPIVLKDGGLKIKSEFIKSCEKEINSLYDFSVTIPDIYFSLDELKDLNLTMGELKILMSFIKE